MSLVTHPNGWLSIEIPERFEARAMGIREERDAQYGNIFTEHSTDARWVGDLGEIVFDRWLRHCAVEGFHWHQEDAAGRADFTLANGCSIGIKTVKRKGAPRSDYTAQVTARHAHEPVDQFFFMSYEFQRRVMWLLGGLGRDAFVAGAVYHGAGSQVHENYQVREGHEIYNASLSLLNTPDVWLALVR